MARVMRLVDAIPARLQCAHPARRALLRLQTTRAFFQRPIFRHILRSKQIKEFDARHMCTVRFATRHRQLLHRLVVQELFEHEWKHAFHSLFRLAHQCVRLPRASLSVRDQHGIKTFQYFTYQRFTHDPINIFVGLLHIEDVSKRVLRCLLVGHVVHRFLVHNLDRYFCRFPWHEFTNARIDLDGGRFFFTFFLVCHGDRVSDDIFN
mmetsp:Transcript_43494/g.71830  ORF Transcript_43494/g.71830 Transcript_43494/m.71830 type:complete len:207 (-) Transcript_43494:49-669(-)